MKLLWQAPRAAPALLSITLNSSSPFFVCPEGGRRSGGETEGQGDFFPFIFFSKFWWQLEVLLARKLDLEE